MILLISICKNKLHELEFVKPVEKILNSLKIENKIIHYKDLTKEDIISSKKIVICGTSLKDNEYLTNLNKFEFIKGLNKPLLGICGGMQIIGIVFGAKLEELDEIGKIGIDFKKEFVEFNGEHNIYVLHNNSITLPENFEIYASSKCIQAIKHKEKKIYAILFHPEVLNKKLIINFSLV